MRGTAPVIIMDVSGTMNPAQRGKVKEVKEVVCELLHPDGEQLQGVRVCAYVSALVAQCFSQQATAFQSASNGMLPCFCTL